ncbi:uncharacterized protein [Blastocystis hominis]|uniref:Hexosyltransferase n=1 Tax=Blastocystis hominis TaxID=12968 RepID=D8LZV9_BLAHO|nr:uncharacterized protein [Blastocystis hominis]CBK21348.2 unnamed protein product [Blastocystis hominis]|eukprot:XP_012895396.1 uncharacterized protein [Blastocystis hominis]
MMKSYIIYFVILLLGVYFAIGFDNTIAKVIIQQYPWIGATSDVPIKLVGEKDAEVFTLIEKKRQKQMIEELKTNDHIPPQFIYPEYQQLDKHLTKRFGLPFTYKRFNASTYHYIPYGYNYTYLAQPKNFCSEDTFMVVMIMSTVKKPEERKVLRETWFKDKVVHGQKLKYLFIVSSSPDPAVNEAIDKEALEYNDILHMDHLDSYNNITMSIMNTFNWLHRNCKSIKYILKGDPDSYFNTPKIVKWLLDLPPEKQHRLYHGYCVMLSKFERNPNKEKYVPLLASASDMIWPYCVGVGYVISSDLLAPLVLASRHYNTIYYNEEMNVGLSNMILNVTPYRYHDYQWSFLDENIYSQSSVCRWREHFGLKHVPLSDLRKIAKQFEDPSVLC